MAILDRLLRRYAPALTGQWRWAEYRSRDWLYRLNDHQIAELESTARCLIASAGVSIVPPHGNREGYLLVLAGRVHVSRSEAVTDSLLLRPGESLRWTDEFAVVAEADSRLIWLDARVVSSAASSQEHA